MGEPLSRVEAILQNILGADNILVPPGSQVEEILQAIYYNTEYEKNPKSRVAEILLAIKNKGVYDGPVLSRVEDILIHKLNGIPYTKHKKEDLSRVEQLLLDWLEQGGGEEIIEYTGTFPMTILANGEPLLDYLITGNTVQSGTPTPDSPIMPQGTGEKTGNLAQWEKGGINTSTGANEAYSTKEQGGTCEQLRTQYIPCIGDSTYVLSVNKYPVQSFISFYDENKNYLSRTPGYQQSGTRSFRADINAKYMRAQLAHVLEEQVYPAIEENAQFAITLGSTPLPYEPYGYKIPISSASTTTPVYLGEVEATRKIKKLVLTGEETITLASEDNNRVVGFFTIPGMGMKSSETGYCNILQWKNSYSKSEYNRIVANGSTRFYMSIDKSALPEPTFEGFIAYLTAQYAAGTPVTVWYVLAEPETAVVNEPLMKIGDYADTLSMEQAGEDVPTNKKPTETVIDVSTSVKPSEGYIKYTEPT